MTLQESELKNMEDIKTIQNITNVIKKDVVDSLMNKSEENFTSDYEKIINLTKLSMKMFANAHYKSFTFLEVSDIEQIKDSLNNYSNSSERINAFKNVVIDDLTDFQKNIKEKHVQKMTETTKQKQILERQIRVFEFDKNKLIMERLSKVVWPYDEKTKAYDAKIANLQIQVQKCSQKIEELQQTKPLATEKDILLYQMSLKDRFEK